MQTGLAIPISPDFQLALSRAFVKVLRKGEAGGPRYELTNPVRFTMQRSRQTIDVDARIGPDERMPMFAALDAGLATPAGGPDVLTPEPLLEHAKPLDSGVAMAIYGGYWQTNSAASTPANSRLVQRAMRGAYAYIDYTNRRLMGPNTVRLSGDPVSREDLTSGTGAAAVDGGIVLPDFKINVEPNPLIVWPRSQVEPFIGFNGANFAGVSLTNDFQVIWVLLCMTANVRPLGRG